MVRIIEAKNLSKTYMGRVPVAALKNADITVMKGEMVAIVGRSGSGKSTLMNILGCMDPEARGQYRVMGRDVLKMSSSQIGKLRREVFGFIFQSFNLIPSLSALENVELALHYRGVRGRQRKLRALDALRQVELTDRAHHLPSQLSGGQQQRVAIARAIACDPKLILADEPTGNLDTESADMVVETLKKLNKDGKTILVVTHDMNLAQSLPRMITIEDGRVL